MSAAQDCVFGIQNYARFLEFGKGGIGINLNESLRLYQKAVDLGQNDAEPDCKRVEQKLSQNNH